MTCAYVPVIDLELDHYIRFMREADVHFANNEELARDTLLWTARFMDAYIKENRVTLEGQLLTTVQM